MYNLGTKLCLYLSFAVYFVYSAEKILNGREAVQGEFPFVVRISGDTLCGGSLVTLQKLVSAAHCFVTYGPGGRTEINLTISFVIGGTIYYDDTSGQYQDRLIESYKLAKNAVNKSSGGMQNDVAVAKLDRPFDLSDTLKVMTIKTKDPIQFKQSWDQIVKSGEKCMFVGWGKTDSADTGPEPTSLSPVLKVVQVLPWTDEDCSKTVWETDTDMTKEGDVCASPVNTMDSVLAGDSGSPLICSGIVWGVLSAYRRKTSNVTHHATLLFRFIDELDLNDATIATASKLIPTPLVILLHSTMRFLTIKTHAYY